MLKPPTANQSYFGIMAASPKKSSSEIHGRIVAQTLRAEKEIKQGKGLMPKEARTFLNDGFNAVTLKTKGVRTNRDEANTR